MGKPDKETNIIRVTGYLTGPMKKDLERDLEKGYKQAELVRAAFDAYYSQKKNNNSY